MARVVVLGIGNVLNSDDGLGPFVARTLLAGWDLVGDAEVLDAGTPGMDLISLLHGTEAATSSIHCLSFCDKKSIRSRINAMDAS